MAIGKEEHHLVDRIQIALSRQDPDHSGLDLVQQNSVIEALRVDIDIIGS